MTSDVWQSLYVLELFTVSFCSSLQSWCEASNSPVDQFLWQAVPDQLQRFYDSSDWIGLRMELVIGLQHPAPVMIVHGSANLEATDRFWWIPAVDMKLFLCNACLSLIAVVERDTKFQWNFTNFIINKLVNVLPTTFMSPWRQQR